MKYTDADGIERRVVAYKDKIASQQLAAKLEKEAELGKEGVVDRFKEHRRRPLVEHLEDFKRSLSARGNTKQHVMMTFRRAKKVIEGCRFANWNDIQASKVQSYVATFNYYLKAAKQFCKWMVQDRRASESPLEHLKCDTIRKVVDEEHPRRALEIDELRRLPNRVQYQLQNHILKLSQLYIFSHNYEVCCVVAMSINKEKIVE